MFRGPLGIWPFPILNLLQQLVQQKGNTFQPAMRNLETIKWTDWNNRERVIEIHREVEASG